MAAPPALAAAQSARLLRLQQARLARLRAAAAQARAAHEAALSARDAAGLHADRVGRAAQASARRLWDEAAGATLAPGALDALRDGEHRARDSAALALALAEAAREACAQAGGREDAARSALSGCARLAARRERLSGVCRGRLARHLRAREEAVAEDDLPTRAPGGCA